jgi:hypothetical protein
MKILVTGSTGLLRAKLVTVDIEIRRDLNRQPRVTHAVSQDIRLTANEL